MLSAIAPCDKHLPPAFRNSMVQLRSTLLQRTEWQVCRSVGGYAHKAAPTEFEEGNTLCKACKLADLKHFVHPDEAEGRVRELLALEPSHFIPRYDQPGCGVDKDASHFDAKDWTSWMLKQSSRGTVLRERLWQCCLGGGKKAADRYRNGRAKRNTTKLGCPRGLYAVTRWDSKNGTPGAVEIYFKHQHLRECWVASGNSNLAEHIDGRPSTDIVRPNVSLDSQKGLKLIRYII